MATEGKDLGGVGVEESVTILIHIEGRDMAKIDAAVTDALGDVLAKAGLDDGKGFHVFIGECVEALDEAEDVEDGEDSHEPVTDLGHSLRHHGIGHGHHIHCHPCRRVRVGVTYNGVDKHHRFSPAATIDTARRWALRKFKIGTVDGETLVLKVSGVEKPPLPDTHLGDLVKAHHHCELVLELVPDHGRING